MVSDTGNINDKSFNHLSKLGLDKVKVVDTVVDDGVIIKCLRKDPCKDTEEALKDIYRRLRPGDPPTVANANALIPPTACTTPEPAKSQ